MACRRKKGASRESPTEASHTPIHDEFGLPRDSEELDLRLEAAFPWIGDFHSDELCVWACACFLVDGSLP